MSLDPQDACRSVVASIFFVGLYELADGIAHILVQRALFDLWLLRY